MSYSSRHELDLPEETWEEFLENVRKGATLPTGGPLGPLLRGVPRRPVEDGRLLHKPVELSTLGGQVVRLSREEDGTVWMGDYSYSAEEVGRLGITGHTDPGIATLAMRVVTSESIDPEQPRPFDSWLADPTS